MSKDISTRDQIAALQEQIASLKSAAVDEVKAKIKEAKQLVADLEKELADLTGSPVESPVKAKRTRRASFSDEDIHASILKVLSENPTGISGKGISTALDINYPRVAKYLADALTKNAKAFKVTGVGAGRRFFLP